MNDNLRRWPLLAVGLAVITAGAALADRDNPSATRAFLLGVGAVIVGAALVLVVWKQPDPLPPRDPRARTRATDATEGESDATPPA